MIQLTEKSVTHVGVLLYRYCQLSKISSLPEITPEVIQFVGQSQEVIEETYERLVSREWVKINYHRHMRDKRGWHRCELITYDWDLDLQSDELGLLQLLVALDQCNSLDDKNLTEIIDLISRVLYMPKSVVGVLLDQLNMDGVLDNWLDRLFDHSLAASELTRPNVIDEIVRSPYIARAIGLSPNCACDLAGIQSRLLTPNTFSPTGVAILLSLQDFDMRGVG